MYRSPPPPHTHTHTHTTCTYKSEHRYNNIQNNGAHTYIYFPVVRCYSSPTAVTRATWARSGYDYGSTTTYTCAQGYVFPNGSRTQSVTCAGGGVWGTPTFTSCQGILAMMHKAFIILVGFTII